MAQDPSEDDIGMLQMLSDRPLEREQAIQILKISNNNVETAVNKMLDANERPNGIAELLNHGDTSWDASAFGNAGFGQHYENTNVPTFSIESEVHYPNTGGPISAAPTRPSSRTTQRPSSAMSTHMGDIPMQSSFYSENGSMQNIEPLTGFSGVESGQESGTVGSIGAAGFRPATQSYYDNASWALVPATKSTEYVPDAPLDAQIRRDKPGLIKPSVTDHNLPALITILHTIPLVRNALLAPAITSDDYWRGEDWWKGTASVASVTVRDDLRSEAVSGLEFLYEVQRLVAFLDASDRTYASLESLLQLDAWTQDSHASPEEQGDLMDVLKFLLRWHWTARKHAPATNLNGVIRSVVNVNGGREESSVLSIDLDTDTGLASPTLYDYIDRTLFGVANRAHIHEISNVLVFSLITTGPKRNCKIPATLFVDRYLEDNRAAAEAIINSTKNYNRQSAELDTRLDELKWHTPEKVQYPHRMETLALLKTSMRAFEPDPDSEKVDPKDSTVLKHLKSLYESVERKLSALEDEKRRAKEALDEALERFRAPIEKPNLDDETSEAGPKHKFLHPYELCGVIRSRTEFYIRRPVANPEHSKTDPTWWHVEYKYKADPEDTSIDRNQTTIDKILDEISEMDESATLIYANEAAFAPEMVPLSAELDTFIKRDNMNFQQEVADERVRFAADWGDRYDENEGKEVVGDWFHGDNGWDDPTNAHTEQGYHSSKTLTPDTDVAPPSYQDVLPREDSSDEVVEIHLDDEKGVSMEMPEMHAGTNVFIDGSNASSETVGRKEDLQMADANTAESKAEHVEFVQENKGA